MHIIKSAEENLASYLGVKHTLLTSAGRTALVVALKALGLGQGDEVVMPSFTCDTIIKSIEYCEAKPIFADVDPETFNVVPQEIEKCITRKSKAIIVIHCYGQPCNMNEIMEIAERNGIFVIEDVAHSFGAKYRGEKVGGLSHISFSSFAKNMNCSSGGAIATDSGDLMSRAKAVFIDLSKRENRINRFKHLAKQRLLNLGKKQRFLLSSLRLLTPARKFADSATNNVPPIFSADDSIGIEVVKSLKSIDRKNEERRRKAILLTELINDLKIDYINCPVEKKDRIHVYYIYGLKVSDRGRVIETLRKIEKYIFWSLPWQCPYGPTASRLSEQLVLFEMIPSMNEDHLHQIASSLAQREKSGPKLAMTCRKN